jgi:hypothetical protein
MISQSTQSRTSDFSRTNVSRTGATVLLSFVVLSLLLLPACITKTVTPTGEATVAFSLTPPSSMSAGSQTALIIVVTNDPQNLGVDWIASCSSASCGSFNPTHTDSGAPTTYTAPANLPPGGTVNLSGRSTAFPAQSATVTVNIISSVSISLTGFPASPLAAGSTTQVTAKVTGDPNNPPLGVSWMVTCGASTNCGQITPNTASGVAATYTAPASVTASLNVTIIATAVADTTQTATTSVTVNPSGSVSIAFAQGAGAPPAAMSTGTTANILAIVSSDNQNLGVDWSISCVGNGGNCGSLNPNNPAHTASGTAIAYTAPSTVPAGGLTVNVTAKSTANPAAMVSANILVTAPVISISSITGAPSSLPVSTKATLSATVTNDPASGGGVDWTVTCTPGTSGDCGTFSLTHTASNVSTSYTAPAVIPGGTPPGNVTITATATANPASFSTATVLITALNSISIEFATGATAPPASLTTSTNASIAAVVTNDPLNPPNGVDWSVTCGSAGAGACGTFSLNPPHTASSAAIVYSSPAQVPTGGTVTITATSTADPSVSVSATITIIAPVVTITITQAVSPLGAGSDETIIASVQNDASAEGVSWTATCTNSAGSGCGTFNPTTSPGNTPQTSYTAPPTVPAGNLSVTITATSVANGVTTGTAVISITPNPNLVLLSGQYALSITGINSFGAYSVAGSIVADGQGNITSGEEDINPFPFGCLPTATAVTGTYSVGSDGRGTMTLETGDTCFDPNGEQTLSFALVGGPSTTTPRAYVIEFDGATSSGSLDLQDTANIAKGLGSIAGGYAFLLSGEDLVNQNPTTSLSNTDFGGVFTVGANGKLTLIIDENDQGTASVTTATSKSGSYTAPDSFGRGALTIGSGSTEMFFVYYVVNSGSIKLLEDGSQDFNFATAGAAFSQGGSLSGPFVFTVAGIDGTTTTPVVAGGAFNAAGTSLGTGLIDVNDGGILTSNSAFIGTFVAPASGRGTLTLPGGITTGGLSLFAYYPTLNNGVLLMDLDSGAASFTTIGTALPQAANISASTLSGNYAMDLTGASEGGEQDIAGQVVADGSSTFTGTVDVNGGGGAPNPGVGLTGNFTANITGRFTGTFSLALGLSSTQTLHEVFYVAGPNTTLAVEMDSNGQTGGILSLQNLTP